MTSRTAMIIVLTLMWFAALDHCGVWCHKLSGTEKLNLRRQLKRLSKPAVTTIQTKYGDTYDCVDFYEQPAFDHPLLKDRKYEFQMSSSRASNQKVNIDGSGIDPFDIWVNGKGCPSNTVPIRKMKPKELIKANMAAKLAYNISADSSQGIHEFAILQTTGQNRYYGGGMIASVYNPQVEKTQYSSSRVKFQNGPDSIAVGWTVNPSLYSDGETRLFIYTIDPANGNWFLQIGKDNMTVGTWPQKIFTGLSDSANYVEWGGEVYGPVGTTLPPMGASALPTKHRLDSDCYGIQVTVINDQQEVDYDPPSLKPYNSSPRNYYLLDEGNHGDVFQRIILFGGVNDYPVNENIL
ncbi:unnamed protein product [Linum tenue]|uniref:Neprosin PEP catalytic domain-containing protein n=1 Tax=Linum tenue TaxID=586396 RepID=A0AAV0NK39_9ROSI|nr:unnamed protein product [Linum tenue]